MFRKVTTAIVAGVCLFIPLALFFALIFGVEQVMYNWTDRPWLSLTVGILVALPLSKYFVGPLLRSIWEEFYGAA